MFGITDKSFRMLLEAVAGIPEIDKAGIYGSRAMGNHKKGSDIDIVVYGEKITPGIILKLKTRLEQELPIPYFFDLTHYESITSPDLKKHIDTFGKPFYKRGDLV